MKNVVLLSGGLDSATLLGYACFLYGSKNTRSLAFYYGQRHVKELDAAQALATHYGVRHDVLDMRYLGTLLEGSALTDSKVEVPEGHYTAENMRVTVVPNRNAIFLSIAYAVAVSWGARGVLAGMHSGDHTIYPDCRPVFVAAMNNALRLANEGNVPQGLCIEAPFAGMTKAQIVSLGFHTLKVPYEMTWSCYRGGEIHCGRCATCVERAEAFALAQVPDPTSYVDPAYWKSATKE